MKSRKFAVRAVMNPRGEVVAVFPYREWRQAELCAARMSRADKDRQEFGSHYVSVLKVAEGDLAKMAS